MDIMSSFHRAHLARAVLAARLARAVTPGKGINVTFLRQMRTRVITAELVPLDPPAATVCFSLRF
jgi:hypothetical protein